MIFCPANSLIWATGIFLKSKKIVYYDFTTILMWYYSKMQYIFLKIKTIIIKQVLKRSVLQTFFLQYSTQILTVLIIW